MHKMAVDSHANDDAILDSPFTVEELAVKVKMRKAAGPDGIVGEHLRSSGAGVAAWSGECHSAPGGGTQRAEVRCCRTGL